MDDFDFIFIYFCILQIFITKNTFYITKKKLFERKILYNKIYLHLSIS